MTRQRQIYNIWSVYAGPTICTGFHYADYNDARHNNSNLTIFDNNLLEQLDRINAFQYGIDIERINLTQLGVRGLIDRAIVNKPSIEVSFDYWLAGIRNEDRLGLVVNYPDITGKPILDSETCILNNFTGWQTDCRNLFVAIAPDDGDINNRISDINNANQDIHPSGLFVFGFGNCYINNYQIEASVGNIPKATVNYVCDNVRAYSSGSGCSLPAVLPKSGNIVPGPTFTIPRNTSVPTPSILRPSDIELTITNLSLPTSNLYDYIYLYNIQTDLYNKLQISGRPGSEQLLINNGEVNPGALSYSGIYLKNINTNLYNQIFTSGSDGAQQIIVYTGINNNLSNVFNILYLKNINNTNYYAQINSKGTNYNENISLAEINFTQHHKDALFGIDSSNLSIQSFNLNLPLEREALQSIGYAYPIDRRLNLPVFGSLNLSTIVDNNYSGNLDNIIQRNNNYDILINIYNPSCALTGREIAMQYKIMGAKFKNANYGYNINSKLIGNYSFELDVDLSPKKSIYLSGLLNTTYDQFPFNYLVLEQNKSGFLFLDNDSLLII